MGRFQLVSFIDLYDVAKQNFIALQEGAVTPAKVFNALCSLEHLRDWVVSDPALSHISDEAQGINDLGYKEENILHSFYIIRQLCNAHKHFNIEKQTPMTEAKAGFGMGRYGRGEYGIGEPSYKVTVGEVDRSFLEIATEAMNIWDDFVERNGLLENAQN